MPPTPPAPFPRRWDPLLRLIHWGIAAGVVANGVLNKPGASWHVWIGWGLMALLALRLLWGLIGPREARFSAFPPRPLAALSHLQRLGAALAGRGTVQEHPSHNPAGAMMAYALWALLAVVSLTGLVMTGGASPVRLAEERAAVAAGDWSALVHEGEDDDHDGEGETGELAEEVHEVAANLMLILAVLHLAGVLAESFALKRNLVRAMTLGGRRP